MLLSTQLTALMLNAQSKKDIMFNPRVKTTSPFALVMCRAALKAAKGLLRDFGEVEKLQVSQKGPKDFVSNADHRAERIIREELQKARPEFGLLLEEMGVIQGNDKHYRWIVDPLDGTLNFLHGCPYFCISIALEKNGEIIVGVVYDPTRDEMFCAEKGGGAFMNEHRLRVSARADITQSLVGVSCGKTAKRSLFDAHIKKIEPHTSSLRRFGASALDMCYLAAGRLDGYYGIGLAPWDVAASSLIIREAGGYLTQMDGKSFSIDQGEVLSANPYLHKHFLSLLKS